MLWASESLTPFLEEMFAFGPLEWAVFAAVVGFISLFELLFVQPIFIKNFIIIYYV